MQGGYHRGSGNNRTDMLLQNNLKIVLQEDLHTKAVSTNNRLCIPCFRDPTHFLVTLSKPPPPFPLPPLRIFCPFLTPSFTIFTSIALAFRLYANRSPILPFLQLARSICWGLFTFYFLPSFEYLCFCFYFNLWRFFLCESVWDGCYRWVCTVMVVGFAGLLVLLLECSIWFGLFCFQWWRHFGWSNRWSLLQFCHSLGATQVGYDLNGELLMPPTKLSHARVNLEDCLHNRWNPSFIDLITWTSRMRISSWEVELEGRNGLEFFSLVHYLLSKERIGHNLLKIKLDTTAVVCYIFHCGYTTVLISSVFFITIRSTPVSEPHL